ncbi:hypothetical protein Acr_23g0004420 [Actinidia rufa]|uniref:Uncharacterized protein n=1 Tax=Actinidia rufa TaxID=165716 RepID=A0A7J0GML0_9ERIC|nr:hypothetical protein Acr_23g0004420 [Actinidia rufa]
MLVFLSPQQPLHDCTLLSLLHHPPPPSLGFSSASVDNVPQATSKRAIDPRTRVGSVVPSGS